MTSSIDGSAEVTISTSPEPVSTRNLALAFARELAPAGIHAATVTVCGAIAPGTWYDPARIAEVFWNLHEDAPGAFREEILYREP